MTIQQPETIGPHPKPLFFFSGVDIAECVKASLVTREYFRYHKPRQPNPESFSVRKPANRRKSRYTPYPPMLMQKKWSESERENITDLWMKGKTFNQISKTMGRTYESVRAYIYRNLKQKMYENKKN